MNKIYNKIRYESAQSMADSLTKQIEKDNLYAKATSGDYNAKQTINMRDDYQTEANRYLHLTSMN